MELSGRPLNDLCRVMHKHGITLRVHDAGQGLGIIWGAAGSAARSMEAAEKRDLERLVYIEEETGLLLETLPDGIFGAVQVWERRRAWVVF